MIQVADFQWFEDKRIVKRAIVSMPKIDYQGLCVELLNENRLDELPEILLGGGEMLGGGGGG